MCYPSLQELQKVIQTGDYDIVPIVYDLPHYSKSPLDILKVLKTYNSPCFLLENTNQDSHYSYLGYHPIKHITCYEDQIYINNQYIDAKHPHDVLREILNQYKCPQFPYLPPFQGGFVGYFGYEYFHYNEPSLKVHEDNPEHIPDIDLMLFQTIIAINHQTHLVQLITHIPVHDLENEYTHTIEFLQEFALLLETKPQEPPAFKQMNTFKPRFSVQEYTQMVKTAQQHIYEGDIFQIVLSNQWCSLAHGSLFKTYQILSDINPSPYMFYLNMSNIEIVGASPETLVKLHHQNLYTYPLAGTRPRGQTQEEDKQNEIELLHDPKELAEHNMLVDLGRNDIGKISQFSTVKVPKYMEVLKFSHVMHLGSTITGQILKDKDAIDAIDALLPAGTLSGAPKVKASSLIYQFEKHKRYLYGGAIGYIDFTGQMDMCIAIRLAYKTKRHVYVSSGAGIVADSQPQNEYQECLHKATAMIKALHQAGGNHQ